eukprot:11585725-Alexandrium_andersonii.AAC.1
MLHEDVLGLELECCTWPARCAKLTTESRAKPATTRALAHALRVGYWAHTGEPCPGHNPRSVPSGGTP